MLEFNVRVNTWEPPEISSLDIAAVVGEGLREAYHRSYKDCTTEELRWIISYCWRHDISTTDYFKVKEYAYDNGDILQVY